MGRHIATITDLVIPDNGTDSNVVSLPRPAGAAIDYVIFVPRGVTFVGTINVLIGADEGMVVGDMQYLNVGAVRLELTEDDACVLPTAAFRSIAIHSSSSETGGPHTFKVRAQIEMFPAELR